MVAFITGGAQIYPTFASRAHRGQSALFRPSTTCSLLIKPFFSASPWFSVFRLHQH